MENKISFLTKNQITLDLNLDYKFLICVIKNNKKIEALFSTQKERIGDSDTYRYLEIIKTSDLETFKSLTYNELTQNVSEYKNNVHYKRLLEFCKSKDVKIKEEKEYPLVNLIKNDYPIGYIATVNSKHFGQMKGYGKTKQSAYKSACKGWE